jgi:hypothetical protein
MENYERPEILMTYSVEELAEARRAQPFARPDLGARGAAVVLEDIYVSALGGPSTPEELVAC